MTLNIYNICTWHTRSVTIISTGIINTVSLLLLVAEQYWWQSVRMPGWGWNFSWAAKQLLACIRPCSGRTSRCSCSASGTTNLILCEVVDLKITLKRCSNYNDHVNESWQNNDKPQATNYKMYVIVQCVIMYYNYNTCKSPVMKNYCFLVQFVKHAYPHVNHLQCE